jgi:hypothetical protein
MLDSSITGLKLPSRRSMELLAEGTIYPLSRVVIYRKHQGEEYPTEVTNVLSYSKSEERQFGAASLSLTASNPDGKYSYSNTDSNINYLTSRQTSDLEFNLAIGNHLDTQFAGDALTLVEGASYGEWTSPVMSGGGQFHSWREIEWQINPGKYVLEDPIYGSVIILARFGDNANTSDPSWTGWQKVWEVTGEGYSTIHVAPILSTKRYIQIKLLLYAAYEIKSPVVNYLGARFFTIHGKKVYSPLFYYGNRIEVYEAIASSDQSYIEWNRIFSGFIDSVAPSQIGGELTLSCEALDNMKICLNEYIEKPDISVGEDELAIFEPVKHHAKIDLVMVPYPGHDDDGDGQIEVPVEQSEVGSVWRVPLQYRNNGPIRGYESDIFEGSPLHDTRGDFMYQPWADRPRPIILVENDSGQMVRQDNCVIDYQRGAVYFNEILRKPNGQYRKVQADFYWYDLDTNLFEDVAGEIIAKAIEKFGYEKPQIAQSTEDYVIWTAKSHPMRIVLERSCPRATVPPIGYKLDDRKTYFDALTEIRKYITPDYLLRATPNGDFVGEHLPQKADADYRLTLVSEMKIPISEEGVYTRCIARGIRSNVKNIASTATIQLYYPGAAKEYGKGKKALVDGNLSSNCGWRWNKKSPAQYYPAEMIRLTFKEPILLGAINVLIGDGLPPPSGVRTVGKVNVDNIGFDIEVSQDGRGWYNLTNQNYVGSTAQWIRIDKSDFDARIASAKIKYIRFLMTSTDNFKWGTTAPSFLGLWEEAYDVWVWAIREIQIYSDETIRAEVTVRDLADVGDIPMELALDMEARLGSKTIALPEDPTLRNYDMVKARALDYLYECARNLYTSEVEVVYAPHIRVGHTVSLHNPYLVSDSARTYYVDGVTHNMDENEPSVYVKLVSWT